MILLKYENNESQLLCKEDYSNLFRHYQKLFIKLYIVDIKNI